jgi:hypothetical protein
MRLACVMVALWSATAAASPKRWYFRVAEVIEDAGVESGMTKEARAMVAAELRKVPEVLVDNDLPGDQAALEDALKKQKLRGFDLQLKILAVEKSEEPPADGKQYPRVGRRIKLSLLGSTIPEKVMAVGGDGDAKAWTEISKTLSAEARDRESRSLLSDVTRDAVRQAVELTIAKLRIVPSDGKKKTKKR